MLHHAFDIFRIDGFTTENPFGFFLYTMHRDLASIRAIAAIGARCAALNTAHAGNHAAVISIIIVAAQHIGFVVIFIFDGYIKAAQAFAELLRQELAPGFAAVGVPAPAHINIGNIVNALPVFRF